MTAAILATLVRLAWCRMVGHSWQWMFRGYLQTFVVCRRCGSRYG